MTAKDFELILIESFIHETKQSYFEAKREQYKCNPNEYTAGLLSSFKELNLRTHFKDLNKGIITKENGETVFVTIRSNPVEVGYANDEDDSETAWTKEVASYGSIGKVSFPNTETINISEYTNGLFKGILNAAMTEELWPHLQEYCQSITGKPKNYIIKSDDLIRKVYDICECAFDCDYLTFRESIETANFNHLNIKKQNIVQDLTYRLSGIMDKQWYTEVCKIMTWRKSTCSGQRQKLEFDIITKNLDKYLPRPTNKKHKQ